MNKICKPKPTQYIVEKGIPIPKKIGKYDFIRDLDDGDSFVVTTQDEIKSVRRKCNVINKRIIQRKVAANEYRIWIFNKKANPTIIEECEEYSKR